MAQATTSTIGEAIRPGRVVRPRAFHGQRLLLERLLKVRGAAFGLGVLVVLLFLAVTAPVIAPYSPFRQDLLATLQKPSAAHLFGTDDLGRDVLSRVIYGSQVSLQVGLISIVEASLSFLGVGVLPPTPSWGSILNDGYKVLEIAPWMAISAGSAIFITVLGLNFLGDGLRTALTRGCRGEGTRSSDHRCEVPRAGRLSLRSRPS